MVIPGNTTLGCSHYDFNIIFYRFSARDHYVSYTNEYSWLGFAGTYIILNDLRSRLDTLAGCAHRHCIIRVYDTMQEDSRCFPSFKKSQLYIKLLLELDLIQENNTPTTTTTTTTTFATTTTTTTSATTTTTLTATTSTTTTTASTNAISNCSSSSSSSSSTTNVCISGSGSKGSNVSLSGESKVNGLDATDILHIQKTKANSLQASREDLRSSRESISSIEDIAIGSSGSNTFTISANIFNTGICQEHGKSYAVYLISVEKKTSDGAVSKWDVYRRYNDFYDLHTLLQSKFESLSGLILPAKKPFDSVNKEFLERRKVGLNTYLQTLLNPGLLKMYKGLFDVVYHFLEHLHWEREKSDLARRVDSFVNPFRSSVRSVGNMVRSVPNSLADGVAKVRNIPNMLDGVGKILSVKPSSNQPTVIKKDDLSGGKVGASLDFECGEDSIPLHIMLLLLDEIFDLKTRNQWLRRRIVAILQQIAKTMFGDSINRKIIESVAYYTSPDQIAEYLKMFRDSFWPGGRLSEEVAQRDHNTKMRMRVVCKTKLYASLSDELRHLIGSETTRHGVTLVFNMFQQRQLNRRLVYVIFEGLLQTIFPENKFYETFRKLHSQSARIKNKMAAEKDKMTSSLSSSSSLLTSSAAHCF
ncbi:hypothetical protein HELRODRAFT_193210 [Helobdella robusta]|uniref:PX domain-containing protein n=1 Tax=Helobdella robusta TaxID=6412 RepID=T1FUR4_HELRO|nr:hypothetical protein HELRODRAFT_193210 [Helobdella robusta]ESN97474.1 hypothetical protein HELRODRAFT_193210 [Helobdella robusta]